MFYWPGGHHVAGWRHPDAETDSPFNYRRCVELAQLAYLLERSPFYRDKLQGLAPVGLADIAQLPLTTKDELRASATAFGPHVCVPRERMVRIYSTSGTTGTPTYIPLTASDVENWIVARTLPPAH